MIPWENRHLACLFHAQAGRLCSQCDQPSLFNHIRASTEWAHETSFVCETSSECAIIFKHFLKRKEVTLYESTYQLVKRVCGCL